MAEYRTTNGPMAYRDRGEGAKDPIVLLHAFPLNSRMWEPQMEMLAGDRRVVTPDYPGFGRSPQTPAQPDVRYYAEGVRSLLDRLGLERVVLGGLSMGGYVAFALLRLCPERISGLVLANTRPDPDSEEMREGRKEMAHRVSREGVEALIGPMMPRLLAQDTLRSEPGIVEHVKSMILECSPDGVVAALGAMGDRPDSIPLLKEITVPTLVIGGEEDAVSTPEVMGAMADDIPGAHHVTLPGVGHLSNLEDPRRFNEALEGFLAHL